MAIRTRLTETLDIRVPIMLAPMGRTSGGALAAAVSGAGGLGMIGAGGGEAAWIDREFAEAGNVRVGCGFITWALARQPEMLDLALAHARAALLLSFGDPTPFAGKVLAAGIRLNSSWRPARACDRSPKWQGFPQHRCLGSRPR
jgi:nitronate monooxygenase